MYGKLAGTLLLVKTGALVATIGTSEIVDGRAVSIGSESQCDGLVVSIGSFVSSFSLSSVVLIWYFGKIVFFVIGVIH